MNTHIRKEVQRLKRVIDLVISLLLLVFLLPFMTFIALFIWLSMGRPIFFTQFRPGKNERLFHLYKFRTMRDVRDERGKLLADDKRLTPFGMFLRKYSLDELPQLFNVIKGEMSLVGPRPLLAEYLSLYTDKQRMRHRVKPGLTGWAQVNGRNSITWEERFQMDIWYVENQSLRLDMKILFLTIGKVLKKEGISHGNEVTMHKFTGSKDGV